MDESVGSIGGAGDIRSMRDEIEQLRTALEAALEENTRLADERAAQQPASPARHRGRTQVARLVPPLPNRPEAAGRRGDQSDEELRVAFEELQVLTEELEVANSELQEANRTLDGRVEERTRTLEQTATALQRSEARFRAVANLVPDLLWSGGRDGAAQWYNERWYAYSGQTEAEAQDDGWLHAVHPVDHALVRNAWRSAVRDGTPFACELKFRKADGSHRWFLARAEQAHDENGSPGQWFGAMTDIHDQRTVLEALGRSEIRFRTLVEGMPQLAWRAVDGGEWTWSSPQWTAFTGLSDMQSRGRGWQQALHSDDRQTAVDAWVRAQETGVLDIETRIFGRAEKRYRHFRTRAVPVRAADGRILEWLGTSTDVDDLLLLQHRQKVLIGELQHRTRNLMTVVQAILRRTLRDSQTLEEFGAAVTERMAALARAQGLLAGRGDGQRVAFDTLLHEELGAYLPRDAHGRSPQPGSAQLEIGGPAGVPLFSASVQTLALALHELATNATKYGALSAPGGKLAVTWDVLDAPDKRWLRIDWRESGVPDMPDPGAPPRGSGHGRELIERALPYQLGARISYAFAADGVRCSIEVPVADE